MSQPTHNSFPKYGLFRGLTNNSTCTTFAVPVPTATEPVSVDESGAPENNALVIKCGGGETLLYPFGTDANDETINFRVYLWRKIAKEGANLYDLWVPYFVGGFVGTVSNVLNGVAGAPLTELEFLCDTITEEATNTWDDGYTPATVRVRSFAGDSLAEVRILTNGYEKLEVRFDLGTGATANVCYSHI